MKSRKSVLCLILAVMLSLSISAEALDYSWICPGCGKELTSNFCPDDGTAAPTPTPAPTPVEWTCPNCRELRDTNFCSVCGARRPEDSSAAAAEATAVPTAIPTEAPTAVPTPVPTAAPTPTPKPTAVPTATPVPRTFEISSKVSSEGGYTTITWTDSENASPYIVYYTYAEGSFDAQDDVRARSYTTEISISDLIPGKTYDFVVVDANGERTARQLTIPSNGTFEDDTLKATSFTISREFRYRKDSSSDPQKVSELKASKMVSNISDKGYTYGLYYKISLPLLKKERNFFVMLAFYAPNGYIYTYPCGTATFSHTQGYSSSWLYLSMIGEEFFTSLYEKTSTIPTGTYSVELYLDGMYVQTVNFKVQ